MPPWFTQENSVYACNLGLRRKTLFTHATFVYAGKLCLRMQPSFTQENSDYAATPPRKRNGATGSAMKWSHFPRKSRTKKRNFSLPLPFWEGGASTWRRRQQQQQQRRGGADGGGRSGMGVEAGGTSPAILPSPSPKTKPRQIVTISTSPCNRDDAHADSLRHMK